MGGDFDLNYAANTVPQGLESFDVSTIVPKFFFFLFSLPSVHLNGTTLISPPGGAQTADCLPVCTLTICFTHVRFGSSAWLKCAAADRYYRLQLRRVPRSFETMHPTAGCLSCKARKKRCDETKPRCRGCQRNFLVCAWPTRKQKQPGKGGVVRRTFLLWTRTPS